MTRIVTDSSADISPQLAAELGITVIPLRIHLGSNIYHDGAEIRQADFYQQLTRGGPLPIVRSPSLEEFRQGYERLLRTDDQIVSIHCSSRLNDTVQVAQEVTRTYLWTNKITVVDSRLISWGLELLAVTAAQAARRGAGVDEVLRIIRGMIPHIYMIFFVENMEYLERRESSVRGRNYTEGLLGVRPLLMMEEGEILPMERIRARGKVADRLFEFVTEFARMDQVMILQGRLTDMAQSLFERLIEVLPRQRIDIKPYGPVLASYLGPDALGVGVYEGT